MTMCPQETHDQCSCAAHRTIEQFLLPDGVIGNTVGSEPIVLGSNPSLAASDDRIFD